MTIACDTLRSSFLGRVEVETVSPEHMRVRQDLPGRPTTFLTLSPTGYGAVLLSVHAYTTEGQPEGIAGVMETHSVRVPKPVWDFLRMHTVTGEDGARFGVLPVPASVSASEGIRREARDYLPEHARGKQRVPPVRYQSRAATPSRKNTGSRLF